MLSSLQFQCHGTRAALRPVNWRVVLEITFYMSVEPGSLRLCKKRETLDSSTQKTLLSFFTKTLFGSHRCLGSHQGATPQGYQRISTSALVEAFSSSCVEASMNICAAKHRVAQRPYLAGV